MDTPRIGSSPICCEQGKLWISWEQKHDGKREGQGPDSTRWAMMVADYVCENVSFCPFCGVQLTPWSDLPKDDLEKS